MSGQMRKRWLGALLSAALVVGLVPAPALAEIVGEEPTAEAAQGDVQELVEVSKQAAEDGEAVANGQAVEDPAVLDYEDVLDFGSWGSCEWDISNEGVLTVHPGEDPYEGEGPDYYNQDEPYSWSSHKDDVTSIVFAKENGQKVVAPENCWWLFDGFENVTSIDASGLDTSGLECANNMFANCFSLQSINLTGWDTSHLVSTCNMFEDCYNLQTIDLSSWNTENVRQWDFMFGCWEGVSHLETIYVSNTWNTANTESSEDMFYNCVNLRGGQGTAYSDSYKDIEYARIDDSYWYPGYLTYKEPDPETPDTMPSGQWGGCDWDISDEGVLIVHPGNGAESTNISPWSDNANYITSVVFAEEGGQKVIAHADSSCLLKGLSNVTSVDASGLNTSSVTNMNNMFAECPKLESIDFTGWDTSSVTNMTRMFYECPKLESLDLTGFDTTSVVSMRQVFADCSELSSIDITGWDTSSVTDMYGMFSGCSSLETIDLSELETGSVTNMYYMFDGCTFTSLDLSGWDTSKVKSMSYMFNKCSSLETLDLSGWDTSSVTGMGYMFALCSNLVTIYVGSSWSTDKVTYSSWMFDGCTSIVGGVGTTYDPTYRDKTYARVDTGLDSGYLTYKGEAPATYTVTFVDEDGLTVLKGATEYPEGTPAADVARPDDPTKPPTQQYTYAFDKWVRVSDGAEGVQDVTGDATYKATYTETARPNQIVTQPQDASAAVGDRFTLTVEATGSVTSYSWQASRNGTSWSDVKWSGHDTATLSYTMTESLNGRMFRCVVTFADDSSETSDEVTVTLPEPSGRITTQPQDATLAEGERIALSVTADGATSYRWQASRTGTSWSDVAWSGAETATLTYVMRESLDGRKFRCVVTFEDGSSEASEVATLTLAKPSTGRITGQPQGATLAEGERFTLSVTADGATSYRWQASRNGTSWSDVTWSSHDAASLSYKMVASLDGRQFRCVVTFSDGSSEVSDVATLTLDDPK